MEPILLIAVLICPLVMGTAMLLMWREMRRGHASGPADGTPSTRDEHPHSNKDRATEHDEAHARSAS
jgi:ABC-type nickel/cobalt efflux system permease component RcnA